MTSLPDIKTDFAEWYQEVVYRAELADHAPVRGCIVVRPYGCALWENIQKILDKKIRDTGHHNALFPLLIPQSFLQKEAQHVEGFAPELAVVTYAGGKELEEPLVVRPTSETIIHHMFARWIKSWRDLPMKVNQWANVVRWEMRTRPFLRTTEFWWQEGHTVHETAQEAEDEAQLMLNQYVDLIENYLAIPVVAGVKSESERFAGADKTLTVEGLMQDGKALQMGTSHLISQTFAKAFGITFQDRKGTISYPYLTSWGATTRLVGAVVMAHGDSKGLVLPPAVAPIQVVVIPIIKEDTKEAVLAAADQIANTLSTLYRVIVDRDEHETPGAKFYKWELKGVPVRIEVGPRDVVAQQAVVTDRIGMHVKQAFPVTQLAKIVETRLDALQKELFKRAYEKRQSLWFVGERLKDFAADLESKGGFYQTGWCGSAACEAALKERKATIRCKLPSQTLRCCFTCDKASLGDILVARAY